MEKWWEHTGSLLRLIAKKWRMNLRDFEALIPKIKACGFGGIELYAPYASGEEYLGLDIKDLAQVDPALGSFEDLRSFLRAAHEAGLYVIANMNVGYGACDYAPFLKASDDVRQGVDSPERSWFLFRDAPEPMERPNAPFFLQDADGRWVYSERAGCYYWVKWFGMKGDTALPQFDFGSPSWQQTCASALALWRDVGFDGFMVDAVNWYVNCDWEINERAITGPIHARGELFVQPEGAGGFHDDPVPWIRQGRYNCVQDYALNLWWEQVNVLGDAIARENPSALEPALAGYRDRVVAAGGVCYVGINQADEAPLPLDRAQLLELAALIGAGELVCINMAPQVFESEALHALLRLVRDHPALAPAAGRRMLPTQDDQRYLALWKTEAGGGETMLAVYNFTRQPARIEVTLPGGRTLVRELPAQGYLFEEMAPEAPH